MKYKIINFDFSILIVLLKLEIRHILSKNNKQMVLLLILIIVDFQENIHERYIK
jgi:hypothetical protein